MNPVKLVVALTENDPLVAMAENDLNYRAKKRQLALPTDPAYARQWHLHGHFNHASVDPQANARCEGAWQLLESFGSRDVVVGVTDDGCKLDHPDFDSSGKFAGWGYFQGTRLVTRGEVDAQASAMYQQGANHGTSCAGVSAGETDAVLTVGAAPGCRLLPVKWESQGPFLLISDSKLLTALNYLADKIDVLSNSWGLVPQSLHSMTVIDRVTALAATGGRRGRGIVFLWAAGNENCPIQHTANVDVPYTDGWDPSGAPVWVGVETAREFRNNLVGIPGVMHVAALASTAQRSHYSNYGHGISVCAPTSNSHEYWRMQVAGLGITTTTGAGGGVTEAFGGTSSATPLTAGIAALVISANPALTALEVLSILQRTASKDLNLQPYPRTPPASFDPDPSWDVSPIAPFDRGDFQDTGHPDGTWSPWFGHGRVDAAAAVVAALAQAGGGPGPTPPGRHVSTPALAIPDNKPAGVRDTIQVSETGSLNFIKVAVNITHTFIGDLRVTLIAPSGKSASLHDRNGGNASNLQRSFDADSTPALRSLSGESVKGDWTLFVQDLAPVDRGRLERWEVELGVRAEDVVEVAESPGTSIPDNAPAGIERSLVVDEAGSLREIDVSVDITHTYIGDLLVSLHSPSGRAVDLHSRAGGNADNLLATYSSTSFAALQALRGELINGTWRLRVSDREAVDLGKLNRWSLRIVKQAAGVAVHQAARRKAGKRAAKASR
jgi:subtilisin-like proprotein convertase family protein